MGGLVYLDWQSCYCYGSYEFLASRGDCLAHLIFLYANVIDVGCILRPLRALHHRRRNTIFSQMEATTYKDAYTADTLQEQWECTKQSF